jgi:DNA-binding NtrC family response regulator
MASRFSAREIVRTVLVIEDDPIIAFDLETILNELASNDVVAFTDNRGAIDWLDRNTPAAAILDFKLTGDTSIETANLLANRSVPIAFVTGYGDGMPLPDRLSSARVFNKPVAKSDIAGWLEEIRGVA